MDSNKKPERDIGRQGKSYSIYKRMIVLIVCFFCIPFLISGVYWYNQASRMIETKAVEHGRQLVEFMNGHLASYFEQLEVTTSSVLSSQLLKTYLSMQTYDEYDQFDFTQRASNEIFLHLLSNRADIFNVSIVGNNGLVASSFSYKSALEAYNRYSKSNEIGAKFSIKGIRWIDGTPVLTIVRNLINNASYRSEGMLIVDIKYGIIADLIRRMSLGQSGQLWVYDDEGEIIYSADPDTWGKPMEENFPSIPFISGRDSRIDQSVDGKTLTVYNRLDVADWEVANRVSVDELVGNLNNLSTLTALIGALLVLLALAVMCTILFVLTRSIRSLQFLMKKAESGDLEVRAPVHHPTLEVANLYRSFNSMVDEINRLVRVVHLAKLKEKEMELRQMESRFLLLQSQINPHFLYNTLEVVNSYAIEAGVDQVSRMIVAISRMFRYNLHDPKSKVSLAEELEHLETYLSIQRERFPGLVVETQFYGQTVDKVPAVRLALQPIVENCFKHGFENRESNTMWIRIEGHAEGHRYHLKVIDRGAGIDPQTAKWLNASFAADDMELPENSLRHGEEPHIGMWNVHSRIRLAFGPSYGLRVACPDGAGTEIELTLPLGETDDEYPDRRR
ncbi:MAG: hypothetical protein K0R28_174 [Paenibacillus sp.]|nr:hypothetical protein [Paenibacillus sp.]